MDIIEGIKVLGGVCGAVSATFALLLFCLKPVRGAAVGWVQKITKSDDMERIVKETHELLKKHIGEDEVWKKQQTERMEVQKNTAIVQLRNTINLIYDKNYASQTLTIRDKESLIDLFEQYEKLGGNHNVAQKYEEMLQWTLRK